MDVSLRFGFLNHPHEIRVANGLIRPLLEFSEGKAFIEKYGNTDGFIYPTSKSTVLLNSNWTEGEVVPNTKRPAAVFDLPLSHELMLTGLPERSDAKREDAGLLVHLLGFFFGTRLQFEAWHFDGRVPIKPTNAFTYTADAPEHFVSWVYERWKLWNPALRRRFINLVYMHSRAESNIWEWDRFASQYAVADAIYAFYCPGKTRAQHRHFERLKFLCEEFLVPVNEDMLKAIYEQRNQWVHEAMWAGATPGERIGDEYLLEKWLSRLNARFIVALAGYNNAFLRHGWWFLGWQPFEKLQQEESIGSTSS